MSSERSSTGRTDRSGPGRPNLDDLDFDRLAPPIRRGLKSLTRLDNHHALLAIAFEYGLVALCVTACVAGSYWAYPVAVVLIGSTQRFLAHFLHESAHKSLARNRILNLVAGTALSGYLVGQLYGPYRSSHVGRHHRRLGEADADPDYRFHLECGLYDPDRSDRGFLVREVLLSLLGLRTVDYLRYLVRDRVWARESDLTVSVPVPLRTEQRLFLLQWAAVFGLCGWLGVLPELLLFWFVPLLTSNIAIGWLSELAEHYPLPESESTRVLLTRNRHGRALETFLLSRHGDRFHLVHHLNAGIPFWNLHRAHRLLLDDPAYAGWDGMWAGVLSRPRSRRGKETVISYAAKYRAWRRNGGDPTTADRTFAQSMMLAAGQVTVTAPQQSEPTTVRP
ncbi:fatty acid desaturase [Streptomyces caelestis]|uniref:fatty acid desaturase n=1 Tax=Streptomyces caelestis TaxID=36816 RepID=UPI0036668737